MTSACVHEDRGSNPGANDAITVTERMIEVAVRGTAGRADRVVGGPRTTGASRISALMLPPHAVVEEL